MHVQSSFVTSMFYTYDSAHILNDESQHLATSQEQFEMATVIRA
jgi:hypothetical protein